MDWRIVAALTVIQLVLATQAQISDLWPNAPGQNTPCPSEGHFPHPTYCDRFYRCILVTGSRDKIYQVVHFVCRDGLVYDREKEECVEAEDASSPCSDSGSQIGTTTPRAEGSGSTTPPAEGSGTTTPSIDGNGEGTSTPQTQGEQSTTTSPQPGGGDGQTQTNQTNLHCSKEGFFRNPENCHKFYRCVDLYGKNTSFTIFEFDCPGGLVFDESKETCNWPDAVDVPCGETPSSTESPQGEDGSTTTQVNKENENQEEGSKGDDSGNGGNGDKKDDSSKGDDSGNGGNGDKKDDSSKGDDSSSDNDQTKGDGSSEEGSSQEDTPCTKEGFFINPNDCGKFYRCVNIGGNETKMIAYQFNCSEGLVFDEQLTTCNYPEMTAPPCGNYTGETSPTPTPDGPKPQYNCQSEGFFRNPQNCNQFFRCVKDNSTDSYLVYKFDCPAGLVFDEDNVTCNWPDSAKPCDGEEAGTTAKPSEGTEGPKTEAPKTEAPKTEAPKTEAPKTESSKTQAPCSTEATGTSAGTPSDGKVEPTTSGPSDGGSKGGSNLNCPKEGFFRNPQNCNKFYRCVDFSGKGEEYTIYQFDCPKGLVFDETESICNWPDRVPACQDSSTKEPQSDDVTTPAPAKKPSTTLRRKPQSNGKKRQQNIPRQREEVKPTVQCKRSGYFRHPLNCNKFIQCSKSRRGLYMSREYTCPPGLVFDETSRICTWPENTTPCYPYSRRFLEAPFPLPGLSRKKRSDYSNFVPGPFSSLIGTYLVRYGRGENALTCPAEGVYPHPNNCHQFYKCVDFSNTGRQFVLFLFVCSDGLAYDAASRQCVAEETTNACSLIEREGTTTTTNSPTENGGERENLSTTEGQTTTDGEEGDGDNEIIGPTESETSGGQSESTTESTSTQTIEESTTEAESETTTKGTEITTASSGSRFQCRKEGFYRDPEDCNKFYRCVDYFGDGKRLAKYSFRCGEGLVFDEEFSTCNWPDQASPPCGSTPGSTSSPATEGPEPSEGPDATESTASTTESSESTSTESTENPSVTSTTTSEITENPSLISTTTTDSAIVESTEASTTPEGGDNQELGTTTSSPSSQSSTEASTDRKPLTCRSAGFYRNPNNCSKFYRCVDFYGNRNYTIFEFDCPEGLVFDEALSVCNWPDQAAPCDSGSGATVAPGETTTASGQTTTESGQTTTASEQTTTASEQTTTEAESTGSPEETTSSTDPAEATTEATGSRQSRRENMYDCPEAGNFPFEADCERFYNCEPDQSGQLIGILLKCPDGHVFEPALQKCIQEPEDYECDIQPPNDKIFCTNSTIVDNAPIAGGDLVATLPSH